MEDSAQYPLYVDLTGQVFGRIVVLRYGHGDGNHTYWLVRCGCGKEWETRADGLLSLRVNSCGCYRNHRLTKTRAYMSWASMHGRCSNPNNTKDWPNYGGRGISVCGRWRRFQNFFADMGERPVGLSLDRINNDGNYEPSNCRWATRLEQNHNRRKA